MRRVLHGVPLLATAPRRSASARIGAQRRTAAALPPPARRRHIARRTLYARRRGADALGGTSPPPARRRSGAPQGGHSAQAHMRLHAQNGASTQPRVHEDAHARNTDPPGAPVMRADAHKSAGRSCAAQRALSRIGVAPREAVDGALLPLRRTSSATHAPRGPPLLSLPPRRARRHAPHGRARVALRPATIRLSAKSITLACDY
jgi:hypothetical protein